MYFFENAFLAIRGYTIWLYSVFRALKLDYLWDTYGTDNSDVSA
jgi:hypothetical protein